LRLLERPQAYEKPLAAVILIPSPVILSEAKDLLLTLLRVNSANNLKSLIPKQSEMLLPPCLWQAWRNQHDMIGAFSST
jgi:hypothetical protein